MSQSIRRLLIKIDSLICSLIPILATCMLHDRKRDSSYRLLHSCIRRTIDSQCTPKRSCCTSLGLIKHDNKGILCLDSSSNVLGPMKDQCYGRRTALSQIVSYFDVIVFSKPAEMMTKRGHVLMKIKIYFMPTPYQML